MIIQTYTMQTISIKIIRTITNITMMKSKSTGITIIILKSKTENKEKS